MGLSHASSFHAFGEDKLPERRHIDQLDTKRPPQLVLPKHVRTQDESHPEKNNVSDTRIYFSMKNDDYAGEHKPREFLNKKTL